MSLFEDYHIQDHACSKESYQIGQRLSVLGNVKSLNLTKKENDTFLVTSRVEVKDGLRIPSALIMIRAEKYAKIRHRFSILLQLHKRHISGSFL